MKILRLCLFLVAIPAVAQIYSGSPAIYPTGQPLANTPMAVCNANPGRTTPPCLSTLAQTYSDETLTTACTVLAGGGTPGPISGLNCTNPGLAGQLGNWTVYLAINQNYWAQFYPNGLQPTIVPFTIGGGGGGGNFPGKGWTYVDPVLTAGPTAVLNLNAAPSSTGFQVPLGGSTTFNPPTQPAGLALDQIANELNFNSADGNNHYLPNLDSISTSPTTNGIIVQVVGAGVGPPTLSTVVLSGNTNDISITNPDGTSGNPTISSATTGVTAGSYNCANITINAFGKITAASSSSCTSGSGNTTSTSLVTGNIPTANGANSIIDSGIGGSGGVLTFNGSTSGTITLTPNSTATTLTLGGSGAVSVLTPAGTASNVVLGTAANTGLNFLGGTVNYAQSGTNVFSFGTNLAKCNGTCNWSGGSFTQAQTFQSGLDTTTPGSTSGAATFRSAAITGGGTTASGTGAALFGSGNNAATGGASETIGNATLTSGGFTGASGAAAAWTPGRTIVGQYFWADTTATTNTLGCITTPGTNGQMPKLGTCTVASNVPWRGAIQSASGQSVFVVKSGYAQLLSHASQTDTAGYFVCIDTLNAGYITVQATSCPSGQTVGTIEQTGSGGTTHNVDIMGNPEESGASGTGNTTTSGAVIGDLPVFTGSTTISDSGFSQSGGTLGLGSNGGNLGVLQLNGSTSGNVTLTPSATSNTLTLGGSGYTSLFTPTGSAGAVSLGTAANQGIYFAFNGFNFSNAGTQVFSAQVNKIQCNGTCAWSGNTISQPQTFQSGLDATTSGTVGGNAIFKSESVTGGATTGSGSGNATFQSGDNSATGGSSQTIGNTIITTGGFLGASGATANWNPGYLIVGQNYWADTTTTPGTLACITTPGTNGQMPKVGTCTATSNIPWIGIISGKTGQSVSVVSSGHISGVISNASSTDTAGYFVCLDTSNAGNVIVQSTSCSTGQSVGVIDQTGSGGTSHSVNITLNPEESAAGAGVSSFTGDGSFISNSGSTGAVTVNLHSALAHTYWGNNTGSTAQPSYSSIVAGDLPSSITSNTTGSAASVSITAHPGLLLFSGLTSSNRTKTVADTSDTLLELGGSYTPTGTWTWTSCSSCVWPTFNQNTTGTAANLSGTPALPNGTTATTQSSFAGDTKLATDNYVDLQTKPIYSVAFTGVSTSTSPNTDLTLTGTGCTSNVCTMTTPSSDSTYRFNAEAIITTAGAGCTAGTVEILISYTNPDNSVAYSKAIVAVRTVGTLSSTTAAMTPSTTAKGVNTDWVTNAIEFRAKASSAITIELGQVAAEANCATLPVFTFRPALYGPLGY